MDFTIDLGLHIKKLVQNQVRMGALKDGGTGFVKVAGDGTSITKKETVTTVTVGNEDKALQIGTISIVFTDESYEVHRQTDRCMDGQTNGLSLLQSCILQLKKLAYWPIGFFL